VCAILNNNLPLHNSELICACTARNDEIQLDKGLKLILLVVPYINIAFSIAA